MAGRAPGAADSSGAVRPKPIVKAASTELHTTLRDDHLITKRDGTVGRHFAVLPPFGGTYPVIFEFLGYDLAPEPTTLPETFNWLQRRCDWPQVGNSTTCYGDGIPSRSRSHRDKNVP